MEPLLTTKEAMRALAVGKTTLYKLVALAGVRPVKLGRASRWRRCDLDKIVQRGLRKRA